MKPAPRLLALVAVAALSPACSGSGGGSASQTGGSTTSTATSEGTTADTPTTSTGTATAGMTSTMSGPTTSTTVAPTTSTTDPSTTAVEGTTGTTSTTSTTGTTGTTSTTDTTSTTGAPDTTGTTDPIDDTSTSTSGPGCVPSPEVCNKLDDDCDGVIDNVDEGGDGICDCLSVALFGNEGWIPSSEFQSYLEAQGTTVDRISLDDSEITEELLAQYDIIILDWLVRPYTPTEATRIQSWVEAGGGLMSMTGHINDDAVVDRANSIIGPMGLTYNTSQGYFDGPITDWLQPHPLTKDITSVSFKGGVYVDTVDDGVGMNTVVATLPPGPVGVAQTRIDGKVFAFGDEWIQFDSEWQMLPEIKQLWVNILGWLSPQNFCTLPQ